MSVRSNIENHHHMWYYWNMTIEREGYENTGLMYGDLSSGLAATKFAYVAGRLDSDSVIMTLADEHERPTFSLRSLPANSNHYHRASGRIAIEPHGKHGDGYEYRCGIVSLNDTTGDIHDVERRLSRSTDDWKAVPEGMSIPEEYCKAVYRAEALLKANPNPPIERPPRTKERIKSWLSLGRTTLRHHASGT